MTRNHTSKIKLPFRFEFFGKVYEDYYSFDAYMTNAMIALRNKFPFLSTELLTSRAKDEWNKKLKAVTRKTTPQSSMSVNSIKKKPLIFDDEDDDIQPVSSKMRKSKSTINQKNNEEKLTPIITDHEIIDNDNASMEICDAHKNSPEIVFEKTLTAKSSISESYLPIILNNDNDRLTTKIEKVTDDGEKMSISCQSLPLFLNSQS